MAVGLVKTPIESRDNPLQKPLQYLKGVGPKRAELLGRLGLFTPQGLLYFLPRDYQDRSQITPIKDVKFGSTATVKGTVLDVGLKPTRGRRTLLEVLVDDRTGTIAATWFNQPFLAEKFRKGQEVLLHGKIGSYKYLQIVNPEFEFLDEGRGDLTARGDPPKADSRPYTGIVPIYPLTEGIGQGYLRRLAMRALEECVPYLEEVIPPSLQRLRRLMPLQEAVKEVHFPASMEAMRRARKRLVYEELFLFQMAVALRRNRVRQEKGYAFSIGPNVDVHVRRLFPFRLTGAQERAIGDIRRDMESPRPMNRLLQGDVGSGKTVVALYAMLAAVANGFQTALMAPTEILAEQHYRTLGRYLARARVKVALFAGGSPRRKENLEALAKGEIDIAVGTHALISRDVHFKKLGLVVVDEQHKFGVLQRAGLRLKGQRPDVLVMTATPIPRSLSLTLFGDLDVSIIDEMPPGRPPVKTLWVSRKRLQEAYEFLRCRLREGRQVFVVYPLIEESVGARCNVPLLRSAKEGARLFQKYFPEFRVEPLHGRMTSAEKERIMRDFRERRIHILVSTVVIEVGIDVPNATIMVIEHAERFGLAQLHQLRGRIGRGAEQSNCLLLAEPGSPEAKKRLEVFTRTNDGFIIAEEDLKLRGPGELFGTRQHGLPDLKVADLVRDLPLLVQAREDAFRLVETDATLKRFPTLKGRLQGSSVGGLSRLGLASVG
ncbi:MAG: ATP-dependent DNA helicase RecG [Candidatus Brocadiaceae bacterium]|nr:ATP-dependent DNA helicase RecG [Candidatus Brocadiaceae bacterium]